MKCHSFLLFLNLFGFLSSVTSLVLTVEPKNPIIGQPVTVTWTKQRSDPDDLSFDLRFVQHNHRDVGLAMANMHPDDDEHWGTCTVTFPDTGKYQLVAVTGSSSYKQIGASDEVQTGPKPTATSTSPSTSSPPPTATPPSDTADGHVSRSPLSASLNNANLPAILGGVIGALLLLTLLVAVFIYIWRRRRTALHRISFHKDMMVQRRLPDMNETQSGIVPYPFASSPIQQPPPAYNRSSQSTDVECAYSERPSSLASSYSSGTSGILPPSRVSAHLGTGHIVPSPRGPREQSNPIKRDPPSAKMVHFNLTPVPQLPALPVAPQILTSRQKALVNRIVQLQNQINDIQEEGRPSISLTRARASSVASTNESLNKKQVLEDMQKQLVWLAEAKESRWALNETDIKPAGYSRHMTP